MNRAPIAKQPHKITIQNAAYEEGYVNALIEQYKLLVDTAERTSAKRQTANTINIGLNTVLIAAYGLADNKSAGNTATAWHWLVLVVGIAICLNWWIQIRSYKILNKVKFEIIHKVENHLPVRIFCEEWDMLRARNYDQLTNIESLVPGLFAVLYVAMSLFVALRR
jgi:hypothetical protein